MKPWGGRWRGAARELPLGGCWAKHSQGPGSPAWRRQGGEVRNDTVEPAWHGTYKTVRARIWPSPNYGLDFQLKVVKLVQVVSSLFAMDVFASRDEALERSMAGGSAGTAAGWLLGEAPPGARFASLEKAGGRGQE